MSNNSSLLAVTALIASCALASTAGAVTLGEWTFTDYTNPDATGLSVTQIGADGASLSYSEATSEYSEIVSLTAQAVVTEGGTFNYSWKFSGFHGLDYTVFWLNRYTSEVNDLFVESDGASSASGWFSYSGTDSIELVAGDTLTFFIEGLINPALVPSGTLEIITEQAPAPVPVAPAGVLLLSAFGFAAAGRGVVRREG